MTTSSDLQAAVLAALTATPSTTDCGARIYGPGDWPTWDGEYPAMKLRVIRENKISTGRGDIAFTTTTTLRALVQVSASAAPDDGGAGVTEAALWRIQRQFEVAVINSYPLTAMLQQFPTIDAQFAYSSEGEKHLAGLEIDLAMEFYQGPDDFAPIVTSEVDEVVLTASDYPPTGFDLVFTTGGASSLDFSDPANSQNIPLTFGDETQ